MFISKFEKDAGMLSSSNPSCYVKCGDWMKWPGICELSPLPVELCGHSTWTYFQGLITLQCWFKS